MFRNAAFMLPAGVISRIKRSISFTLVLVGGLLLAGLLAASISVPVAFAAEGGISTQVYTDPTLPNGANGWYITAPAVMLVADQPGTTYYQWDSTDPLGWQIYSISVTAPEGIHTLNYYSVDALGNAESPKSESIKVDTIMPAAYISSPAAETTVADCVSVVGEASDANFASYSVYYGSGKRPLPEPENPGGVFRQGTWWRIVTSSSSQVQGDTLATWDTTALDNSWHTLRIVAVDQAGNTSTLLRAVKVGNAGRRWLDEVTSDSRDIFPEPSPDGQKIVFWSDRLGNGMRRLKPAYGRD